MTFQEFQATRVERDDICEQIAIICDYGFRPGIDSAQEASGFGKVTPGCTYTFGSKKVLGWIEKEADGQFWVDCGFMNGCKGDRETVERFLYDFLVGECGEIAA